MGLFMHRPEEPTEWAGLPSEPNRSYNPAERLEESAPVASGDVDVFAVTGTTVESIVIPVVPVVEIAESPQSAEGL